MTHIENLINRYPSLSICAADITDAHCVIAKCFDAGRRLYICGNGGSAADALHITGELVKSFVLKRPLDQSFAKRVSYDLASNLQGALPAFTLVENPALSTAFMNDCNPEYVFAQQVYAYARESDCVLGISTSGNSKNIIRAIEAAKGRGAVTLGLTGADGGKLREYCDICICVPATETFKVQELHLPVYHVLCLMLEEHFWGDER